MAWPIMRDLMIYVLDHAETLAYDLQDIDDAMRAGFRQLLDEALARDAVIRMTGRYDPDVVFTDVVNSLNLSGSASSITGR